MNRCYARLYRLTSALAIVVLVWTGGVAARADDIGANKVELIQSVLPAVVNVTVKKDEVAQPAPAEANAAAPPPGLNPNAVASIKAYVGSGFVIDPSGLIVTNYHVVENAFEITVTFTDGSRLPGQVLSASRLADIALLKVNANHPCYRLAGATATKCRSVTRCSRRATRLAWVFRSPPVSSAR